MTSKRLLKFGSNYAFHGGLQKGDALNFHRVESMGAGVEAPAVEEGEEGPPSEAGDEVGVAADEVAVEAQRVGLQREVGGYGAHIHACVWGGHIAECETRHCV